MWLLASTAANIAFACGAAIVSFFLIRRSRRYLATSRSEPGSKSSVDSPGSQDSKTVTSAEVSRGQVQLHDTARELMGQLDSKMSALQGLIRLADEAAARLEIAADRAERLASETERKIDQEQNSP